MTDLSSVLKSQPKPKRDLSKFRNILMALGSVLLVIGAGAFVAYFVIKNNPGIIGLSKDGGNGESLTQSPKEELNETIEMVGKLMLLPNEIPTLATVTDLSQLNDQEFFVNAQIGDKVLIYTEAKKAILYRPSEDKIIEVGTVRLEEISEQDIEPTVTPTQQPLPTLPPISPILTPTVTQSPTPTIEATITPTEIP